MKIGKIYKVIWTDSMIRNLGWDSFKAYSAAKKKKTILNQTVGFLISIGKWTIVLGNSLDSIKIKKHTYCCGGMEIPKHAIKSIKELE